MSLIATFVLIASAEGFAAAASASTSASASATGPVEAQAQTTQLMHLPLIPHRAQQSRRMLSSSSSSTPRRREEAMQVGALYQGYGTHYVDLWVGTPTPQRQTLIVDTGSGVTAFPCSECGTDCGSGHHVDDLFDESISKSYHKVTCDSCKRGHCSSNECRISMSYQEGSSWTAFEAEDMAYIGGPHDHGLDGDNGGDQDIDPNHAAAFAFPMTFGCQTHLTGLFKTQLADGIMGMDDAPAAFWAQMYEAKKIPNKQFSLCFTRQNVADKDGTESGAMTMGGSDERLHTSKMIYAARQGGGNSGFYNVHVRKVYLREGSGGDRARSTNPEARLIPLNVEETNLNRGNVIVDSGTTDTYFTKSIAMEFNSAFHALTGRSYSHSGVSLTDDELLALPTILLQIAGDVDMNQGLYPDANEAAGLAQEIDPEHPYDILLAIPASHYMEFDDKMGKYVARFYPDENGGTVLGANAMMGHDVFFDLDNKRIGWAESDCDYYSLVTNNGFVDTLHDTSTSYKPAKTDESKITPKTEESNGKSQQNGTVGSDVCRDTTCRGIVATAVLLSAILVGTIFYRLRNTGYRTTGSGEMEMNALEDFTDVRYRDDFDDEDLNDAAPTGTGYTDEPATREIA